jgi:hypothetical protein
MMGNSVKTKKEEMGKNFVDKGQGKKKDGKEVRASRDTIGSASNLNLNKSGIGNNRKINFASEDDGTNNNKKGDTNHLKVPNSIPSRIKTAGSQRIDTAQSYQGINSRQKNLLKDSKLTGNEITNSHLINTSPIRG